MQFAAAAAEKSALFAVPAALRRFAAHKINKRSVYRTLEWFSALERVTCLFVLLVLPGKCSYAYALAAQDVHNGIYSAPRMVFDVAASNNRSSAPVTFLNYIIGFAIASDAIVQNLKYILHFFILCEII
jgi:hypothetical protein